MNSYPVSPRVLNAFARGFLMGCLLCAVVATGAVVWIWMAG